MRAKSLLIEGTYVARKIPRVTTAGPGMHFQGHDQSTTVFLETKVTHPLEVKTEAILQENTIMYLLFDVHIHPHTPAAVVLTCLKYPREHCLLKLYPGRVRRHPRK